MTSGKTCCFTWYMLLLKTVLFLFQLRNRGPSTFSKAMLDIEWPYRFNNGSLLYITKLEVDGDGGMNCSTDMEINPLNVSVRHRILSYVSLVFSPDTFPASVLS